MTMRITLLAGALLACLGTQAHAAEPQASGELPLSGAAYRIAEQAYAAHARGDHAQAVAQAREAVRLRPDVARLHALLAEAERAMRASHAGAPHAAAPAAATARRTQASGWNARVQRLEDAGAWSQAWTLVERALADRPHDAALRERRGRIGRQLAATSLRRAWAADTAEDPATASAAVAEALTYAPDLAAAHLLHVRQQLLHASPEAAIDAARRAIGQAGGEADTWLLLGELQRWRGDDTAARQAWQAGVDTLPPASQADLRLALADAALADVQVDAARQWLQPRLDAAGDERRRLADAIEARQIDPALLLVLPVAQPDIACGEDDFGVYCRVQEPAALSWRLAEQAQRQARDDPQAALALFDAAALVAEQGSDYRARADASRADLAYRLLASGRNDHALALIGTLDAGGALQDTMLADAAYAALRVDARAQASGYFRRALDADDAGRLVLAPQQRFQFRRALAEIGRDRGFIASFNYRGDGSFAGLGGSPLPGDNLQLGWEGYLRPQALQRQGRYVEFHARLTGNAWSRDDDVATGGDTLQAAFGVRARPLRTQNLVLAVERLQRVGDAAIDDWLLRAAWSHSQGTDLRVDVPAWWSQQVYAEAGRYLDHGWNYAIGEWQGGRSWRWGGTTVVTPHLAVAAEHNEAFTRAAAIGAGGGVNLRQWFRQSRDAAPRSWVELSVQYRLRVGGDARAEGWFIRGTLNY